ncbi:MAG: NAD-dependent protein deacylase [Planctomycetes bacterium]|nr:NAD-dependent protein deacylase [Planctomycetota bacterium]MCW8137101.1 NAD-dependent protein deacylase [Planctomycetota bacterium]
MSFELPQDLKARLCGLASIGVITGAGISAESGIPTYRGKGGIYDDPEQGDRTIEALSAPTLRMDPDRAWQAIAKIAGAAHGAKPNAAHYALVEIERKASRFFLLTQNVDGFHAQAGSRNLIDIHGDTFKLLCMQCGWRGELGRVAGHEPCIQTIVATGKAPLCRCGGTIRPDVVFFGEMLPMAKVLRLHAEFYDNPPEAVISVGTSSMFPYIVEPVLLAAQRGKLTIEINPEETEISAHVDFHLKAKAGEALTAIAHAL